MSKSELAAFIESKSSRGKKRNPLYGHGIYDADFPSHVTIGNSMVSHPAYSVWSSMLARCYSEKRQAQNPSYIGCSVSHEWHFFSEFLQFYRGSFHDGYHLDKDLLVIGNRTYSPQPAIRQEAHCLRVFALIKIAACLWQASVLIAIESCSVTSAIRLKPTMHGTEKR